MHDAEKSRAVRGAREEPATGGRARDLLVAAEAAAARLTRTAAVVTGRVTVAAAVVCAVFLTSMLSAGPAGTGPAFLAVLSVALVVGIGLAFLVRRDGAALPLGWDRRLGSACLPVFIAPIVLSILSTMVDFRPELPAWLAAGAGMILAAPLAASGLWLIRRQTEVRPAGPPGTTNPFVVLAALSAVESVRLPTLRRALAMPDADLDRILEEFDDRNLVDLGWGGAAPGRRTQVRATSAGRTAHSDLHARLSREADGTSD